MKRMVLVFVVMMLVSVSVVGIAGCAVFRESPEKHTKRLLKEKYNEEFEVLSTWGNGGDSYGALCHPVRDKGLLFSGYFSMSSDNCDDDYYNEAIISHKIQEMYTPEFRKIFDECYVYPGIISDYSNITDVEDITIENFIKATGTPKIAFFIGINAEKYLENNYTREYEMLQNIMETVELSGFDTTIGLYFLSAEEYKEYQQYFTMHSDMEGGFDDVINGKQRIGFGFENGIIKISKEEYETKRKEQ